MIRNKSVFRATSVFASVLAVSATAIFLFEHGRRLMGHETSQFGQGMLFETTIILGMFMGSLALALHRRGQILKLQNELVERQCLEIDVQVRAMNTHAIVSVTDPNARIISVNDNFLRTFGYERHEVIGASSGVLYDGKDDDPDYNRSLQTVRSGRIWTGEHVARTKSGELRFMQCTILPMNDENGTNIKNISLRTDVTDARKASSDRFLKAMLDDLQDEVYIFDTETLGIRYMNNQALRRCDWTIETAQSKTILDTGKGANNKLFRKHVAPLFDGTQKSVRIELEHDKGPVEISTKLYTGGDGRLLFLSVLRDITERRRLENARLETVSVVSHELRTPLTSIKGALRLLKSGKLDPTSPQAAHVLDIADRNSERLLLVVNDILDLEKIQHGKMKFDMCMLNIADLLQDAVEMNQRYGDELDVKFVVDTGVSPAFINGNADRLNQVMSNLMSNAAKFSYAGDTVVVGLHDQGNTWRVTVSDSGPGIPESVGQTIFDGFTQLDPIDGVARGGTGLGLTISKNIVQYHRGRIGYESKVGEGTTFYFDLPKMVVDSDDKRPATQQIAAE